MSDINELVETAEEDGCPRCGSDQYVSDGEELICDDCGYSISICELLDGCEYESNCCFQ